MALNFRAATAFTLVCLLSSLPFSYRAEAGLAYLTSSEVSQLRALCSNTNAALTTTDKKHILLFHRDGYVPAIQADLPDAVRADNLASAAAVLCLDDDIEELEVCKFNVFFSVARERRRFRVEAVSLDPAGGRLGGLFMDGPEPVACNQLTNIDNTVTSVRGDPVKAADVLDFLAASNLDRADNDRDGLRNLEEFRIGSDPDNAASPQARAAVRVNDQQSAILYAGETAEIRLDLYPGPFIGNVADYLFWADMPDGPYIYQYPAGFIKSQVLQPVLSAPLVRMFNFRLLRLKNLQAGDYQFHFEARDSNGSIDMATANLSVVADPCRETSSLPLAIHSSWTGACQSTAAAARGYLARYYTFSLTQQSNLQLELDAGTSDAYVVLRAGKGRQGGVIDASEPVSGAEILGIALDAGDYTAEVILKNISPGNAVFSLSSSNEVIPWQFTDVTQLAGFDHVHGYLTQDIDESSPIYERLLQVAGVAAGDYDQDGWTDLYVAHGSIGPNLLYRNMGDGTFEDRATIAGVDFSGRKDGGVSFADMNGDGWPDLFLGGLNGTPPKLLRNNQDGTFTDVTETAGLADIQNSFSASFADFDKDGDLDLYVSHWNMSNQGRYLYSNDGKGVFTDISTPAGIPNNLMADYTPIFSDINNDGWLDLLVASDFNTSQVYLNNKTGGFDRITDNNIITDENGMGAAAGDYDNDGDIDWFVTSIFDPNGIPSDVIPGASTGATGNRLYRNKGDGTFDDVTESAGVRLGGWGWGSCFADFNNDGKLDIFHVNGFITGAFNNNSEFLDDGSRIFLSNGDGTFSGGEQTVNLADTGQGRGIVCFDYDLDGDIDLFVANNQQAPKLYRNDGGNDQNFLHVRVGGDALNLEAIGARVYVTTGGMTQMREIYAGNNYVSSNPSEAYFGVGNNAVIDELRVVWPSGDEKTYFDVPANQMLTIFK